MHTEGNTLEITKIARVMEENAVEIIKIAGVIEGKALEIIKIARVIEGKVNITQAGPWDAQITRGRAAG